MPLIGTRAAASAQGFSFTQIASAVDRLFEYVSLLLTGNGTNGAQNNTFLDSSTNNFTVTRNGNTTQGSFSPFGDTWSNYFDGSGDYFVVPLNTALNPGTGDFTFECWFYASASVGYSSIFEGTNNGLSITFNNGKLAIAHSFVDYLITDPNNFPINQWAHIAAARSGTTLSLYLNGTRVGTATNSTNFVSSTENRIGRDAGSAYITGYLSNLRIVKGTAVYNPSSTTITIPTSPLTAITNTSLLTCQSNRFIDNSTNNFAITVNGNTSVQKFSPFLPNGNTWSNYFDGTGDYLDIADNAAFSLGTNSFTIELWLYQTANNITYYISQNTGTASTSSFDINVNNLVLSATIYYGSSFIAVTGGTITLNSWNHVALSRSGSNMSLYLNGTRVATSASANVTVNDVSTSVRISGINFGTPYNITGYVSSARIVNGTAVYDPTQTTLTVPTAPLTAISGTSLLTCQNSTIRDNSPNRFPITVNGNVAPNTLSPFLGFSGYFDGAGDSLTVADNAALEFGSGDFTIECYFNSLSVYGTSVIFCKHDQSTGAWIIYRNYATIQFYLSSNGTTWDICNGVTVGTITTNTWAHVAISRSGSSIRSFLNGVLGNTTTSSSSVYDGTQAVALGANVSASGDYFAGYISNARIVKGTAVYTAAFTPPAVPVLPITNTSLLLNFANAGIQDVAMINDIETVGNAQVSTVQSKFGGSSFSFDGAGDYLSIPTTTALNFGTANFTVECWAYFNSTTNTPIIWTKAASGITLQKGWFFAVAPNLVYFGYGDQFESGEFVTFTVPSFSNGVWYHLAATRVGSTVSVFVNGTMYSSTLSGAQNSYDKNAPFVLGSYVTVNGSTSLDLNGYIDEFRITNGIARYVSNFNPPPAPFKTY